MREEVQDAEDAAFQEQDHHLCNMMLCLHYSRHQVESYLEKGLLTQIIHLTFQYYVWLMDHILWVSEKHKCWQRGSAEATLEHFKKGLWKVRHFSPMYTIFIPQVYIFLRDAADKSFFHPKMNKVLWNPSLKSSELKTKEDKVPKPTVLWFTICQSRLLHNLFDWVHKVADCPLGTIRTPKAWRKAASNLANLLSANSTLDKQAKLKEVVKKLKGS